MDLSCLLVQKPIKQGINSKHFTKSKSHQNKIKSEKTNSGCYKEMQCAVYRLGISTHLNSM